MFFELAASHRLERRLCTDGNVFVAVLATDEDWPPLHPVSFGEIRDVVRNPDDRTDPWFYQRQITRQVFKLDIGIYEARTDTV